MRGKFSVTASDFNYASSVGQLHGIVTDALGNLLHEDVCELLLIHRQHRVIGRVV